MRRRIWFRVHSWLGVFTGLLLFVVCWSGTVATLGHEIDWLLAPGLRVEPRGEQLSLARLHDSVARAFPQAKIDRVHAPLGPRYAAQAIADLPGQRYVRVYLNPYTGEILGTTSYFNVQRFLRSFHYSLFGGMWGLYFVSFLAVPLLVSLVAPLVFYRRWWVRFFHFRTGRGWRVFWSDAHKAAGLWSLAFGLVIALTGAWYLFEAVRLDLIDGKFAFAGEGESAVHRLPGLPPGTALPLNELLARAELERPDLQIKTLALGRGYLYVDGQSAEWLLRDRANKLYLNATDGSVAFNQRASELPLYWRWSDTADPLHFGDFAGLPSKLAWFGFGLILSGLCLTGAYLHAKRLALETGGRTRWPGTAAALAASGLVLAASVRAGWVEIKSYGATLSGVQQWPEVPAAELAFLSGWVLVTLAALTWWAWLLWHTENRSHSGQRRASQPSGQASQAVEKTSA